MVPDFHRIAPVENSPLGVSEPYEEQSLLHFQGRIAREAVVVSLKDADKQPSTKESKTEEVEALVFAVNLIPGNDSEDNKYETTGVFEREGNDLHGHRESLKEQLVDA